LGVRMSKAFSKFESTPTASASLGQVHLARLRDGRPVAVKVQRPNIREQMAQDLDALGEIAEFLDNHTEFGQRYEFTRMLEELRKSLMRELDYRQEAHNLVAFREQLKDFTHIVCRLLLEKNNKSRELMMDYDSGV